MHPRTFNSLIVLLTLAITLPPLRPAAAQAPTDEALIARIDALAAETLAHPGAAGLSIAVARGDRLILSKGYGQADLELDVAATETSLFRIASVTKQFTAAAILRLAEQGNLALDDDFTRYVDYPTHGRTITIFNSILVYFTREQLSIAVLSNSPAASAGQLAAEIARAAFRI